MAHSYVSMLVHYVFSTKDRCPIITPDLRERLYPYLAGVARKNAMKALAIGGTEDHVHMLLAVRPTVTVSKAIQLVKGVSSRWVHETFPEHREFEWQQGYGAFSVGISQVPDTVRYIDHQSSHHQSTTFQEEFLSFLRKHNIEYDPRSVLG